MGGKWETLRRRTSLYREGYEQAMRDVLRCGGRKKTARLLALLAIAAFLRPGGGEP